MRAERAPRYTLHTGEALTWLMSLPDESADALITDPPYCSGGRTTTARKVRPSAKYQSAATQVVYPEFEGESRDQRSWGFWMNVWLTQAYRVLRAGAPACVFTDWRQLPMATDALQAAGFVWRGLVVWDKTGSARPVLGRFTNQAEYIVWGSKGPMPTGKDGRRCNTASNILPGVFTHRVDPADKYHTTGKPVPLMRDIARICEPGGLILDPLAGSGSTGVAALELGYGFLGCELLPEYARIATERLDQAVQRPEGLQLTLEGCA